MIIKIVLSVILLYSLSHADNIKKNSPFTYLNIDTSSTTQDEIKSIYFSDYKNGVSILPSVLTIIQKKDRLNKRQLYLECNEALFKSIFKGTIVEKINYRNGLSQFVSDCKKIVLQYLK